MAGGSGTRFWPLSRRQRPKQLLTLTGERSLIQATFDRCRPDLDAGQLDDVLEAVCGFDARSAGAGNGRPVDQRIDDLSLVV